MCHSCLDPFLPPKVVGHTAQSDKPISPTGSKALDESLGENEDNGWIGRVAYITWSLLLGPQGLDLN